jgi:hypothetical protein
MKVDKEQKVLKEPITRYKTIVINRVADIKEREYAAEE